MSLVCITARLAKDQRGMELVEWAVFAGLLLAIVLSALLTFGRSLQAKFVAVSDFISAI